MTEVKYLTKEEINKAEEIILRIAKNSISRNLVRVWIKEITSD